MFIYCNSGIADKENEIQKLYKTFRRIQDNTILDGLDSQIHKLIHFALTSSTDLQHLHVFLNLFLFNAMKLIATDKVHFVFLMCSTVFEMKKGGITVK